VYELSLVISLDYIGSGLFCNCSGMNLIFNYLDDYILLCVEILFIVAILTFGCY